METFRFQLCSSYAEWSSKHLRSYCKHSTFFKYLSFVLPFLLFFFVPFYVRNWVACFRWRFADPVLFFSLFARLWASYWTWEEGKSKTGHAYNMFSFALLCAWMVKQSLFSCPWLHSVGGECTTMIEDEGAAWVFFFSKVSTSWERAAHCH